MYGLKKVRNRRDDALSRISWQDFERLLATYYRGQGYQVEHVGTGATSARYDGGIDLKLRRDDEYILVQCKHWNACQVAHNDVHQLLGIMVNEGATGAILVTSGEFTRAAKDAAQKQGHVQLVDGDALRAMVGPLPEPDPELLPSPVAAELVFRGPGSGSRSTLAYQRQSNVWWWVLMLACLIVFVLLVRALLDRTAWSAGDGVQSRQEVVESPPVAADQGPSRPEAAPVVPEMLDHYTQTVAWPADPARPPPRTPTAADVRESQRKADEAMKLLEADTPEI